MNGYQYLIQRNRLMCVLEDELRKIGTMPGGRAGRRGEASRMQAQFDIGCAALRQVAERVPG